MKNIAIVAFLVLTLASCSSEAPKCEGNCADSTVVATPAVDTTVVVDTTAVVTPTAVETTTVK